MYRGTVARKREEGYSRETTFQPQGNWTGRRDTDIFGFQTLTRGAQIEGTLPEAQEKDKVKRRKHR